MSLEKLTRLVEIRPRAGYVPRALSSNPQVEIHPVWRYSGGMQRVVRIFDSFEDADRADRDYYASLTPQQRLEILLDLIQAHSDDDENQQGFARVYRVVELAPR